VLPTSKVWAIALLIAVAGVGFALGALTTDFTHKQGPPERRSRDGYVAWLADRLDLDSVQADSVRTIMQHYRPAMHALFDQVRPQMDSLRDRMRSAITDVLTAEQRQQYDSLIARERAMRERGASPPRR